MIYIDVLVLGLNERAETVATKIMLGDGTGIWGKDRDDDASFSVKEDKSPSLAHEMQGPYANVDGIVN